MAQACCSDGEFDFRFGCSANWRTHHHLANIVEREAKVAEMSLAFMAWRMAEMAAKSAKAEEDALATWWTHHKKIIHLRVRLDRCTRDPRLREAKRQTKRLTGD